MDVYWSFCESKIWFTVATLSLTLAVEMQSAYQFFFLKNMFELKVLGTQQGCNEFR